MQSHINVIRDLCDQLTNLGSPVSDIEAATLLVNSMPDQYENILPSLGMLPVADLTFDKVTATLLAEDSRRQEAAADITAVARAESAFIVANSSRGPTATYRNDRNKANRPTCDFCGKPGHVQTDCYSKNGYPPNHARFANSSRPNASTNGPHHAAFAHGFHVVVLSNDTAALAPTAPAAPASAALAQQPSDPATHSRSSTKDCEWLIDSAASLHLCHTRACFADLRPTTNKKVVMANNDVISAAGHGPIHVRIPFNGRVTAGTFHDVLYVPDLSANLLSVSKLTEAGMHLSFQGQYCIIRSKEGHVIGRAEKQRDTLLYRLIVRPSRGSVGEILSRARESES
jgi:hypothetical protein